MNLVVGVKQDDFLIVTDSFHNAVFQYHLGSKSVWRAPFKHTGYRMTVTCDNTTIYWTSQFTSAIKRADLNGTNEGIFKSLHGCMCFIHVLRNYFYGLIY